MALKCPHPAFGHLPQQSWGRVKTVTFALLFTLPQLVVGAVRRTEGGAHSSYAIALPVKGEEIQSILITL